MILVPKNHLSERSAVPSDASHVRKRDSSGLDEEAVVSVSVTSAFPDDAAEQLPTVAAATGSPDMMNW